MIDSLARKPSALSEFRLSTLPCETLLSNARWKRVVPKLSILIPTYRDSADLLIQTLSHCHASKEVEIIVFDDGTNDEELTANLASAVKGFRGAAALVSSAENKGRAEGRNRLQTLARSDWLLFLDADMLPDDADFITRYLDQMAETDSPLMVVGGFSLKLAEPSSRTDLHWAQSEASECVPAETRQESPGRYVFTSNVLVHRDIMMVVPFDPDFKGWGWEDVDWGIRVSKRFPVLHIDNTATHLGLDPAKVLLRKYRASGDNFWLALNRHPEELEKSSLGRLARLFSRLPGIGLARPVLYGVAACPGWLMPLALRLLALKLYRAAVYGGTRHDRS
ncbi:MAG: family 2 glycosyl transferase [Ponticaulis sp.]|nr:family 2 glycosyl transferase [Ponticaulis sp.]|tara:strand:- start:37655 stop:38662 length:1008 start_codon:yes stop_codon:yes gene_type:complete